MALLFIPHHIKKKIKNKQKPPRPPRHRQIEQQLSLSLPYKINYKLIKLSEDDTLFSLKIFIKQMNLISEGGR